MTSPSKQWAGMQKPIATSQVPLKKTSHHFRIMLSNGSTGTSRIVSNAKKFAPIISVFVWTRD